MSTVDLTAEQAKRMSLAAVERQKEMWPAISALVTSLIARREKNHLAEAVRSALKED